MNGKILNKKKIVLIGILIMGLCLTACGKKKIMTDCYRDVLNGLGDDDAYAFLIAANRYPIMVTSDLIYDTGAAFQASTCCDIYYESSGTAQKIGDILSEGTAYPLTFSKDGIFAASGHSVEKYFVSDKDGLLHLKKGVYETFDESGNALYTSKTDDAELPATEKDYQKLVAEYFESQIINFSYGASGCINELLR